MVVRMRHTRSHTRNRRAHHALKERALSACSHCGAVKKNHLVCMNCGYYREREIIDVISSTSKKEAKKKNKKAEAGAEAKAEAKEESK